MTAGLAKVPPRSAGGVVFRLQRGGKLVAKRGFGIRRVRSGKRTVSWRLPKGLRRGRYRLITDVTVVSAGERAGRARARRSAWVRLG